MRKRRLSKVGINTKLIIDVAAASLIVQKAPGLIDMVVALPESIKAVAGVGAAYLVGSFMKRPDLANAGIALGVIDFVSPMIDSVIGGTQTSQLIPSSTGSGTVAILPGSAGSAGSAIVDPSRIGDYIRLQNYVYNPANRMNYDAYAGSYSNN